MKKWMRTAMMVAVMAGSSVQASASQAFTPLWLRDVMVSPDGQQVLFCYKGDIYKVSTKGGTAVQLTTHDSYECSPVWSADGKQIAFASDRHGNLDIFTMSADGGSATRLTYNSVAEVPQAFSPDGKWVLFGAAIQDPAASVMFPDNTLPELYKVPAKGGRTLQVLGTPAEMLSFAADGKSFYYQDRKGYEDEWRKHHTSSITRDVWFYDAKSGQHTNITAHAGEDRNPVASADGKTLHFLSERNGGSMNVYALNTGANNGQQPVAVTTFKTHPVRFLSAARNGLLCYTYNGEIYTQKNGSQPQKLSITLTRDDEPVISDLTFTSGARQAVVSRDGKQVAFVARGEVFVTSTEYATTRRISQTAGAEADVDFAPDGRTIVYASERNGNWQLYTASIVRKEDLNFANATLIKEESVFPELPALQLNGKLDFSQVERQYPKYSPDGTKLAFIEDRIKLKVVDLKTKKVTQVTDGSKWYRQDGGFDYEWSPDGKWFVLSYIANKRDPYTDQGIVSAEGGEIHPITQSGYMSGRPRWVMDGKAIMFESERYGMRSHASWGSQEDVFLAFLTQDAYDRYRLSPEDYALLKELEKAKPEKKADADKKVDKKSKNKKDDKKADADSVKTLKIEFEGIEDRIVRLTPNSSRLGDAIVSKDGESLYYFAAFEGAPDLWKMDLRKHETKLLSKGGSGVLQMDKDGNLYSLGSSMKKIEKGDKMTTIAYDAQMKLDLAAEREYLLRHVAKQINKKIFRTDYNGCDWDLMVKNYARFLPHIANNYDFAELLSELLGELNVSHTGGRFRPAANGDATAQLGLLYDLTEATDGLKITAILEGGPFSKASSKVKVGDVVTAINGQPLTKDTDLAQLLNLCRGKKTLVSLKGNAGTWDEVVLPISQSEQSALLYKRWIKSRAAEVERLSNGRLGYVHIEGMDDASFRDVYSDILGKYNLKEGIVIDTRHNGGGRLHEDIEILFSGHKYFTQVIRGREVCDMPSRRYNHPSIMLQAEGNYSNAHGTPWVYSHQKIGKLVGAPVPGTMSSVNWETMQDPTLIFGVPVIGYQLPDGTYLENTQLEPDVPVLNKPETVVKGVDLQLEAAVRELLKQL
ncbi:S41 family peptidase [Prevotella communis]|uniref:S41 family peptidase n=1 Tax=Prevotella communis TaxID=2913614 RepID=UPI001ED9E4A2|nr:S41 family peptidase [Prevotella communis]UKK63562.1 S41 family peptidase [Prevotella communis]UKK66388.1 S41 family peptidase [Prevotella communis]